VISTAIADLWYGFGVALEPHNLMYCFFGVLVGNLVGVLPGMGPVATISILLPLTRARGETRGLLAGAPVAIKDTLPPRPERHSPNASDMPTCHRFAEGLTTQPREIRGSQFAPAMPRSLNKTGACC
jgi:hypothetical protein